MTQGEQFWFEFAKSRDAKKAFPICEAHNSKTIAIYTVLCVLRTMKECLGLEAMLEYLERYLRLIDSHNPQLKSAVQNGIARMSMEKMYRDAIGK